MFCVALRRRCALPYDVGPARVFLGEAEKTPWFRPCIAGQRCAALRRNDLTYQYKKDTFCYCNYKESGTMLCCEKCDMWFHDECLGFDEYEVNNIDIYYCAACENRYDILTKYKVPPLPSPDDKYCYCREGESGLMIECGKCKEWFHNTCLNLPESTLNQTLLYFCKECILKDSRKSLKIVSIDYSKEHTIKATLQKT